MFTGVIIAASCVTQDVHPPWIMLLGLRYGHDRGWSCNVHSVILEVFALISFRFLQFFFGVIQVQKKVTLTLSFLERG